MTADSTSLTTESEFITHSDFTTTETCPFMTVAGVQGVKEVNYFNVSFPGLIKDVMKRKHLDELHAKVIDLDKNVSVQPEGIYSIFFEGIERFMDYICNKLKDTGFTIRPKKAGSLYAGLKVALPLETDYVYIIEDLNDRKLQFSNFISEINSCIGNIKYIKYNNARFKIIGKKRTRVAFCLTLECRDATNELREGFSVDIVPACKASDSNIFEIKYRDGAEDFIQNCEVDAYPITLLSTGRDSYCDLGLIKHSIFKSLDDDTRRELRVAKYLATRALFSFTRCIPSVQGMDDIDSKRLLGYSARVSSSFYLSGLFLHILITAHKSNQTESLKKGVLALCTLELLKRTFEFFSTHTAECIKYVCDPLVAGLMYSNHLNVAESIFYKCARTLEEQIDLFLKSEQLDTFNLRVCEKTDTECDR